MMVLRAVLVKMFAGMLTATEVAVLETVLAVVAVMVVVSYGMDRHE
jgi:hypothetical protein